MTDGLTLHFTKSFAFTSLLIAVWYVLCAISGSAWGQECGDAPPVADEKLKSEAKVSAQLLSKKVGQADLSGAVEKERKEILSKYPNADKSLLDITMLYMVCTTLRNDKTLTALEKIKAITEFRKVLNPTRPNGRSKSAPDRKGTLPETPHGSSLKGGISAGRDITSSVGPGGTSVIAGGDVIIGPKQADFDRLTKELGVRESALKSFFKILQERQIPSEDLDSKLREIAGNYKKLTEELNGLRSDDPHILQLQEKAAKELDAGNFDAVEDLLLQAKELNIKAIKHMRDTARTRELLAADEASQLGSLKAMQYNFSGAANYMREAVDLLPSDNDEKLKDYLSRLMWYAMVSGDRHSAKLAAERVLALEESKHGTESPHLIYSLFNLATASNAAQANLYEQRALAIYEKAEKTPSVEKAVGGNFSNLGVAYQKRERYAEAEAMYLKALAEHPEDPAALLNLATVYIHLDRPRDEEATLLRAVKANEKLKGKGFLIMSIRMLATHYEKQMRYSEAETYLLRLVPIIQSDISENTTRTPIAHNYKSDLAETYEDLARYYLRRSRLQEATASYEEALELRKETSGADSDATIETMVGLGLALMVQEKYGAAQSTYEEVFKLRNQHNRRFTARAMYHLGLIYEAQKRYGDAISQYKEVLESDETLRSRDAELFQEIRTRLGHAYTSLAQQQLKEEKNVPRAEEAAVNALQLCEEIYGENAPQLLLPLEILSRVHSIQQRNTEAKLDLQRLVTILEINHGIEHPWLEAPLRALTYHFTSEGLYGEALPLLERTLRIQISRYGDASDEVSLTRGAIALVHSLLEQPHINKEVPKQEAVN